MKDLIPDLNELIWHRDNFNAALNKLIIALRREQSEVNEEEVAKQVTPVCAPAATLILHEDFSECGVTSEYLEHWSSVPQNYDAENPAFVNVKGKNCGHYFAKQGTNESTPWQVSCWRENVLRATGKETFNEFCIEWSEYFEVAYSWPQVGQKMFRAGFDDSTQPESKKELGFSTLVNGTDIETEYFQGMWGFPEYGVIEGAAHSKEAHPVDEWVMWRIWAKLNTPGASDGFIRVYKDGDIFLGGECLDIRGTDPLGWNYFWIGGNFTCGVGEVLSGDAHRYIADISWWNTMPD